MLMTFAIMSCYLSSSERKTSKIQLFHQLKPIIYWLIIDPHNDQHPVGLVAQLVELCSGIAEVKVRVPFRPEIFRSFFNVDFVFSMPNVTESSVNGDSPYPQIGPIGKVLPEGCPILSTRFYRRK